MKFHGSYEALRDLVYCAGINGQWEDRGNLKQYRAENGAILNWWESTGTILFQGKAAAAAAFEKALLSYQGARSVGKVTPEREPHFSV